MSTNSEQISANSIFANSGNISAINSNSITNANVISTDTLTVNNSVQVGGNLSVNSNAIINGSLTINGGISFGEAAIMSDDHDFTISGSLFVEDTATFSYNTVIGSDKFDNDVLEGFVSATNIRATSRLFVGDSSFRTDANTRRIDADTYVARLATIIADVGRIASAEIETLRTNKSIVKAEEVVALAAEKLYAKSLTADSFIATSEFGTKNLTVDGSEVISGGLTINGASRDEGALVVNSSSAIFNNGIKVYSNEGTMTQTMTIIGTTDTTGDTTAETEEGKFAFRTAPGVRSLFMGDVVSQDSTVILDNTPLIAETINVTKLSNVSENDGTLQLFKSGAGWQSYLDEQVTYEADSQSEDETAGITQDEISSRGQKSYSGKAVNVVPEKKSRRKVSAADVVKARSSKRMVLTRAFTVKSEKGLYRIDAGGNMLAKNIVSQNMKASSLQAHEILAASISVGNLVMDNVTVPGIIGSESGASISGVSEFNGQVYNYSTVTNKNDSTVEFVDQSKERFARGSTLKVEDGASLITNGGSDVVLHGAIELDMANLILVDSRTGKKYKFLLRDAEDGESDTVGDTVMEFGEISENEDVAGSTGNSTRNRRKLSVELEEFQAKLKRI